MLEMFVRKILIPRVGWEEREKEKTERGRGQVGYFFYELGFESRGLRSLA